MVSLVFDSSGGALGFLEDWLWLSDLAVAADEVFSI